MSDKTHIRPVLAAAFVLMLPLSSAWATHRSEAEDAIERAKVVHQQAESAGVAAATATEMINEAQGLLDTRQYTHAAKLANWAERQDRYALEVAKGEVAPNKSSVDAAREAIAAAVAAADRANSAGGEWRDTRAMIEQAEALSNTGEFERAIQLADVARQQGELGYDQAMREQGADLPDFMRKAAKQ